MVMQLLEMEHMTLRATSMRFISARVRNDTRTVPMAGAGELILNLLGITSRLNMERPMFLVCMETMARADSLGTRGLFPMA